MLGLAAAVLGAIIGGAAAYLLAQYLAGKLIDVSFGFGISVPVIVASLVLGPGPQIIPRPHGVGLRQAHRSPSAAPTAPLLSCYGWHPWLLSPELPVL